MASTDIDMAVTTTDLEAQENRLESAHVGTEQPTFEIEQVQLQFDLNHLLHKLCVRSNTMYLILEASVYKINLENPSEVKQFRTPASAENKITDSWIHPNGLHLIIEVNHQNYFYLHESYKAFKVLPRFRNLNVKLIAFSTSGNCNESTGDFLIATKEGSVYVALIKSHDTIHENKKDDKYVKLAYKQHQPVLGLTYTNNDLQINLFIDKKLLIWDCFENAYTELIKSFKMPPQVVPIPALNNSSPIFESNGMQYLYLVPSTNEINSNDPETSLSGTETLNFTKDSISTYFNSMIITPHHLIALNQSHSKLFILDKLANSSPTALNLKEYLQDGEKILGITADYSSLTYWLYTSNSIYELIISNESISVWFNYYKLGKYEEALQCLEQPNSKNLFKKDMILVKQGYDFLQKGGYGADIAKDDIDEDLINLQIRGIKILAESSEPFEKVCLMLLNLQQSVNSINKTIRNYVSEKLLVEYLMVKFHKAKTIEKNRIRVIILSSWIIELMLRSIYGLDNEINSVTKSEAPSVNNDSFEKGIKKKKTHLGSLNDEFEKFLTVNYKVLDSKTVYQIIGDLYYPSKLIFFAELIKDYEFILNYYIDLEDWLNSLKTTIKIYTLSVPGAMDIIYRKSTVLLMNNPKETVDTWLKLENLNYEKLLPAILTYNKNNSSIPFPDNHSIFFLSKVIFDKGGKNKIVNNYYLSLLISYPCEKEQTKKRITRQITKFLNYAKTEAANSPKKIIMYDAEFILRLCLSYQQYQPAIIILINDMGLYEQALKLALDHDLTELAEFVLKKHEEFSLSGDETKLSEDDYELVYNKNETQDISKVAKIKLEEENFSSRKRLWIMFAKYIINGICQGKDFEILNIVDDENADKKDAAFEQKNDVNQKEEPNEKKRDGVKDVTSALLKSMNSNSQGDGDVVNQLSSSKLSKALKYLLNLSYANNSNSNAMTLKDLLPLFPESIMISNFKEEIVQSLNQYNTRINQLSMEMQESMNITHNLKKQIKDSKTPDSRGKIYTIIEPGEPCQLCQKLLINKNFVCFPNCHHNFHKDCLIKYYLKLKSDYRFKKIFQNFKKNSSLSNKKDLDEILLKECILCNDANISSIDANLVDAERNKSEIQDWEL